jgi:hypothetical protein
MNENERELAESVRELAATARQGLGPHPEADELAAYHAGALEPADENRVRDHLVLCAQCGQALLDLAAFADPAADDGEGLPSGLGETVWSGVLAGIHAAEDRPPAPVVPMPQRPLRPRESTIGSAPRVRRGAGEESPHRSSRRLRIFQALAAALLCATVGLSLWVASLRRTVDELSRPQLNAPVIDLYTGTMRSEGAPSPVATVPAGTRLFIVTLNPAGRQSATGFRVEIDRVGGGAVWSGTGHLNADGLLSLALTRAVVGPGEYRIRLFETGSRSTTPIEEYALRVAGR